MLTESKAPQVKYNQPPELVDYNLFSTDNILKEWSTRGNCQWNSGGSAEALGALLGTAAVQQLGFQANENPPRLRTLDRFGNRIDEVEYHPAYHELMAISWRFGIHCSPWEDGADSSAHLARAIMLMLVGQNEQGHTCPLSMTYSVVPALRTQPEVADQWLANLNTRQYDPRFLPIDHKKSVIFGMGMTERQGGSDVRANTTSAVPCNKSGPGNEYRIDGHKWFCSAPMSDAFLILAQTQSGPSCFLVPRWTPDGQRNSFAIQRLKDKLGNRSNASSEVEFHSSHAVLIGEEGDGIRTILNMVNLTRLDCAIGSAALMRQALVQAIHHCLYRRTFGSKLIEHDLMKNVLADLALESEAATTMALRLAQSMDERSRSETKIGFFRIASAISKFWICKRTSMFVAEALECLGGNGYVEESILPRLYRESPLNSVWEGSGNVICLDVLRALKREPEALNALLQELTMARGCSKVFDEHLSAFEKSSTILADSQAPGNARRLVEQLAILLQSSLLIRFSPDYVSDLFVTSRLEGDRGLSFGTLPITGSMNKVVERAWS